MQQLEVGNVQISGSLGAQKVRHQKWIQRWSNWTGLYDLTMPVRFRWRAAQVATVSREVALDLTSLAIGAERMSLIALKVFSAKIQDWKVLAHLDSPCLALAAALFGLGMRSSSTCSRHHRNMSIGM
jgi:hypothetical protein